MLSIRPVSLLRKHQRKIIAKALKRTHFGVFSDPGTGKTAIALFLFYALRYRRRVARALVVTPASVMSGWKEEAAEWEHLERFRIEILDKGPEHREQSLWGENAPPDIWVISYECLSWLTKRASYHGWLPFDMIICDESAFFKNFDSVRCRNLFALARPMVYRMILTGTPAPNGRTDLWTQMAFLTAGQDGFWGSDYSRWRNRWFDSDYSGFRWSPRTGAEKKIDAEAARHSISLAIADCVELEDLTINDIHVRLRSVAWGLYQEYYDSWDLPSFPLVSVQTDNPAVWVGGLRRIVSGAVYKAPGDPAWVRLHNDKLERLAALLEETPRPVMIVYEWQHERERILELLKKYRTAVLGRGASPAKRQAIKAAWNDNQLDYLLIQPQAGGVGLNLQKSECRHQIWFTPPYSSQAWNQTIARLYRSGQTRKVIIHRLIATDTIDEDVVAICNSKVSSQEALLERLLGRPKSS